MLTSRYVTAQSPPLPKTVVTSSGMTNKKTQVIFILTEEREREKDMNEPDFKKEGATRAGLILSLCGSQA